jgi:hypothetical protein
MAASGWQAAQPSHLSARAPPPRFRSKVDSTPPRRVSWSTQGTERVAPQATVGAHGTHGIRRVAPNTPRKIDRKRNLDTALVEVLRLHHKHTAQGAPQGAQHGGTSPLVGTWIT